MAQVPPSQGQPQSYSAQHTAFGSSTYSSGHPSMGHSQNAALGAAQYPSGGQPVPPGMMQVPPGAVPMPLQMNPAFAGQQAPMGGHPQFIAGASGFAPMGTAYSAGAGAYERSSTGGYGQPQAPGQGQQQPQPPQQQQQKRFVAVPPGMTRESMRPGYIPGTEKQAGGFNPEWSMRDSFGQKRNNCCIIS